MDTSDKVIVTLAILLLVFVFGFIVCTEGLIVTLSIFAIALFIILMLTLFACHIEENANIRTATIKIPKPDENGYCNEKCPFRKSIDLCSVDKAVYKKDNNKSLVMVPGKGCPWG